MGCSVVQPVRSAEAYRPFPRMLRGVFPFMKPITLYPYQEEGKQELRLRFSAGQKRVMVCAPTGSGKTIMAIDWIRGVLEREKTCDFIVDRESLCQQTSDRFSEYGVEHGILMGKNSFGRSQPVRILSAQTIARREIPLRADLTVVDEAHVVHKGVMDQWDNGKFWLGLSATPFRKGLANYWESVVTVRSTLDLCDDGWLTKPTIYYGTPIQPTKKTSTGEFDKADISDETLKIVGDVVREWENRCAGVFGETVKTIVFAATVVDGEALCREFRDRGHDFWCVNYTIPADDRAALIQRHRDGDILGLVSVESLNRGYDVPDIKFGIDCHPYRKAFSQLAQMIGRTMRRADGKDKCIWHCHSENIPRFRDRLLKFWREGVSHLEEAEDLDREAGKDRPDRSENVCPECGAAILEPPCGVCGWEAPIPQPGEPSGILVVNGRMKALEPGDERLHVSRIGRVEYDLPDPSVAWKTLLIMALNRRQRIAGRNGEGWPEKRAHKWCQVQFKKLYGEFRRARYSDRKANRAALTMTPHPVVREAVRYSAKLWWAKQKRRRGRGKR